MNCEDKRHRNNDSYEDFFDLGERPEPIKWGISHIGHADGPACWLVDLGEMTMGIRYLEHTAADGLPVLGVFTLFLAMSVLVW